MASKSSDYKPPGPRRNAVHASGPESPRNRKSEVSSEDIDLLKMSDQFVEAVEPVEPVVDEKDGAGAGKPPATKPVPLELSLPSPDGTAEANSASALLAVSVGVFLGIGALVAFWLLWSLPPSRVTSRPPALADVQSVAAMDRQVQASMTPAFEQRFSAAGNTNSSPHKPRQLAAIRNEIKPGLPPLGAQEEALLLERGKRLMVSGDVAGARLTYEFAAHRNSVDAMFALAQLYDPENISAMNLSGIRPDRRRALKWYGQAADLGHDGAGMRKRELELETGRLP